MPNIKLKPCPFCGEMPTIGEMHEDCGDLGYSVMCINNKCPIEARTAWHTDLKEVVEAWNRRANDE